MESLDIIATYHTYSTGVLDKIRTRLHTIAELTKYPALCIYAGGAFGRLEANQHSGPDLLLISGGNRKKDRIPRLSQTIIDAALIDLVRELGLPSFSNDGEYLHVHYIDTMLDDIGVPEDDRSGALHARMTLLLESVPVYNEASYQQHVDRILYTYCHDFHPYPTPASPSFLLKDILRYWQNLQLNYLYQRHVKADDYYNHLCNLKLIISKKLTIYSLILTVLAQPALLKELVQLSPMKRLQLLPQLHAPAAKPIAAILEIYSSFLQLNEQPFAVLVEQLRDTSLREHWYSQGDQVLNKYLYQLFQELAPATTQLLF